MQKKKEQEPFFAFAIIAQLYVSLEHEVIASTDDPKEGALPYKKVLFKYQSLQKLLFEL